MSTIDKKLWQYEYEITFTTDEGNKVKSNGIVLAKNGKDAFDNVFSYYIDPDSDFISITITGKEFGEVDLLKPVFEVNTAYV